MSNGFNIKATPKIRVKEDFPNFYTIENAPEFSTLSGKIFYTNKSYPGKNIYEIYFMQGNSGKLLSYMTGTGNASERKNPIFTLDELNQDSIIIFFSEEAAKKADEQKKNK